MGFWVAKTKNGSSSCVGAPLHRHPVLLHRLEQRRLRLGRGPIDLVGQQDVGEHRSRREHHLPTARLGVILDDVGPGDVGRHQVGGELNPGELQVEDLRHRLDQQRLGEPRDAHDEAVAADEQGLQHLLDDLVLPDDLLVQLRQDLLPAGLHLVGEGDVVGRLEIGPAPPPGWLAPRLRQTPPPPLRPRSPVLPLLRRPPALLRRPPGSSLSHPPPRSLLLRRRSVPPRRSARWPECLAPRRSPRVRGRPARRRRPPVVRQCVSAYIT